MTTHKEEALMGDTDHTYALTVGGHKLAAEGRCAMEWVAYLAGEAHSDEPACVSRVLRVAFIQLNDCWDNTERQRLRPLLARCIGTRDDGLDEWRIRRIREFEENVDMLEFANHSKVLALLNELLPTVPLQVPVADDAALVCGLR